MTITDAPMKTRNFAAILYRSYRDADPATPAEVRVQADKTAREASQQFFSTHKVSADKMTSIFKKTAELGPAQLADPTQRGQLVAHLRKAIPEAQAWTPPMCPVTQTPLQGPTVLEIENAKISPNLCEEDLTIYAAISRAVADACRQDASERGVRVENLIKQACYPQLEDVKFFTDASGDKEILALEDFSVCEPEEDCSAILGIMRELKHWLHNCGAFQVRITAQ